GGDVGHFAQFLPVGGPTRLDPVLFEQSALLHPVEHDRIGYLLVDCVGLHDPDVEELALLGHGGGSFGSINAGGTATRGRSRAWPVSWWWRCSSPCRPCAGRSAGAP